MVAGCNPTLPLVSEAPLPVKERRGVVGLHAFGSVGGGDPFPLLIDTGSVLTARSVAGDLGQRITPRRLQLLDADGILRARFEEVAVLDGQLGRAGIGPGGLDLSVRGGVLGGDLLQRFSVDLQYGPCGPRVALLPAEVACSCTIASQCPPRAVLPFTLAGGGTLHLDQQVYVYPPTRVTVDVCVQPRRDPDSRGESCVKDGAFNAAEYSLDGSPGVDARLLVATGFAGLILGASLHDRLGGRPFAQLERSTPIYFPGRSEPVLAATASLGSLKEQRAAIALVERLGLLGPCGELNRSRRLRAHRPEMGPPPRCDAPDNECPGRRCPDGRSCGADRDCGGAPCRNSSCLQCLPCGECNDARGTNRRNDLNQPAAAYVELDGPLPIYVLDDASPVLREVNFDVRPALSDVEGIVGSELLARLRARIDYPGSRLLLRCADEGRGCRTFPRYICPNQSGDCGGNGQSRDQLCVPPSRIRSDGGTSCPRPSADGGC